MEAFHLLSLNLVPHLNEDKEQNGRRRLSDTMVLKLRHIITQSMWCCEDEGSGWPSAKDYRSSSIMEYFHRDLFSEMSDIFSGDSMSPTAMDTLVTMIDEWDVEIKEYEGHKWIMTSLPHFMSRFFNMFPLPLYTEMDRRVGVAVHAITYGLALLYIKERFPTHFLE